MFFFFTPTDLLMKDTLRFVLWVHYTYFHFQFLHTFDSIPAINAEKPVTLPFD